MTNSENTISGGYKARIYENDQTSCVQKKMNYIETAEQTYDASIVVSSNNKITVTEYSQLKMIVSAKYGTQSFSGHPRFAVALFHTQMGSNINSLLDVAEVWKGYDNTELNKEILCLDVSAVTKDVYAAFWIYSLSSQIYAMWLE